MKAISMASFRRRDLRAVIIAALMSACPLASFAADAPVTLPLSQLPAFPAPELTLESLSPDVARNVKTALADAAEGMTRMAPAEAAIRAAAAGGAQRPRRREKDGARRGRDAWMAHPAAMAAKPRTASPKAWA